MAIPSTPWGKAGWKRAGSASGNDTSPKTSRQATVRATMTIWIMLALPTPTTFRATSASRISRAKARPGMPVSSER